MQVYIQQLINNEPSYRWFLGSDDALSYQEFTGGKAELADFVKSYQDIKRWILMIPGVDCLMKQLSFGEQERKHILKAIPYLLEETVLSDVDELHLVTGKAEKNHIDVIAIEEQKLADSLEELESIGITPQYCFAEQTLLLAQQLLGQSISSHHDEEEAGGANEANDSASLQPWFIHAFDDYGLVALSQQVFAVEWANMDLAIELLVEQFGEPSSVQLQGETEVCEKWQSHWPEKLQANITLKLQAYSDAVTSVLSKPATAQQFNLLKGSFARTVDWLSMVKPWRWVLVALVIAYFVQVGFMWSQKAQLEKTFQAQEENKEALFRQAIPRGNIVDHQKQLQRELDRAQSGGSSDLFILSLEKIGQQLAKAGVKTTNSMQYEAKTGVTRLDFLVQDYDSLQAVIADLKAAGFTVDINNSNAQDDMLRVRLNVKP